MWIRQQIAREWDMAWFCAKCEKMIYWKTKGWHNPAIAPHNYYCDECKEKIEKAGCKNGQSKKRHS